MIQIIPVSRQQEKDDEQLQEIYQGSFPPEERREWNQLKQLLAHSNFNLNKILKNNILSGMISIWRWPEFIFIEHFAIHENLRNQGIGKEVIQQIIDEKPSTIIVEVDLPNNESDIRRIAFYKLLGFSDCEQEYYQPPYHKGFSKVKMLLLSYPRKLNLHEFDIVKTRLYRDVYQWDNFKDFP